MTIRLFDWRDFPILLRYRNQELCFDSAVRLTRGSALTPAGALLSYFAPATGIFTYLYTSNGEASPPLVGQVNHPSGSICARLSFLSPESGIVAPTTARSALPALLEHLIIIVGERGALHLLADVDEHAPAFDVLRRVGFATYARQRIWQLTGESRENSRISPWRVATASDEFAVRCLYNNLVPGLVQQVEPLPANRPHGVIYRQNAELLAYVELRYGSRGIWAQPFIHPNAEDVPPSLGDLLVNLPNRHSRPVYVCVRSYQSWLETALEDSSSLRAIAGSMQAVMVKHLTISMRPEYSFSLRPREAGQPEPTAPYARSQKTAIQENKDLQ